MNFTIFYAWQSDSNERANRYFIRDAIKAAIKDLRRDDTIEDAPRLDHDTKGVAGTPDIFRTILDKIEQAGIFLADITYVAKTAEGKFMPNPNVMLELGYALAKISDRRIITVLNNAMGDPEQLPFDLARHRWPICYTLEPDDIPTATARQKLATDLAQAIRDIIATGPLVNADLAVRARIRSIVLDPANEVSPVSAWKSEQILLLDSTARGIFELLKDLPEPKVACVNAIEQNTVADLINAYRTLRLTATTLDSYATNFAGSHLAGNTFVKYWQIIAGFCVCIADGWKENDALLVSQTQSVGHDGSDCKRIYGLIKDEPDFQKLVKGAREARNHVIAVIEKIRAWRF